LIFARYAALPDIINTLEKRAEEFVRLANLTTDPVIQAEILGLRQRLLESIRRQCGQKTDK
jgi:hypothetical protein